MSDKRERSAAWHEAARPLPADHDTAPGQESVEVKGCGWGCGTGHTSDECTNTERQARVRAAGIEAGFKDALSPPADLTAPLAAVPTPGRESECRTCAEAHPTAGCADVGCSHNCEAEVATDGETE